MQTLIRRDAWWGYLQLMRPANIVTAWADILAGSAAVGALAFGEPIPVAAVAWLLLATTGLYGGGVVFNDVFDAQLDAIERPERPIPSGRVSRQAGIRLGSLLLLAAALAAAQVSLVSMAIAVAVALAALLYDAWSKHTALGSLNMGLCRGGNLLLGLSALPAIAIERWYLALIPVVYIAAVTAISQGEVNGGRHSTGVYALLLLGIVTASLWALALLPDYRLLSALPFGALWLARVLPPWLKATQTPYPDTIRIAVKRGVLSLIFLDASLAAGFAGVASGLLVLSLFPLSSWLAQRLAVT